MFLKQYSLILKGILPSLTFAIILNSSPLAHTSQASPAKKQKIFNVSALANRFSQRSVTVLGYNNSKDEQPIRLLRILLKDPAYSLGLDFVALMIDYSQAIDLNDLLDPRNERHAPETAFAEITKDGIRTAEQEEEMYLLFQTILEQNKVRNQLGMPPLVIVGLENILLYEQPGLEILTPAEKMAELLIHARNAELYEDTPLKRGIILVPLHLAFRRATQYINFTTGKPDISHTLVSAMTGEETLLEMKGTIRELRLRKSKSSKRKLHSTQTIQKMTQYIADLKYYFRGFFQPGQAQTVWVQAENSQSDYKFDFASEEADISKISQTLLRKNEANFLMLSTKDAQLKNLARPENMQQAFSNVDSLLIYSKASLNAQDVAADCATFLVGNSALKDKN